MLEILSIFLYTHLCVYRCMDVHGKVSLRKVSCGISYVPGTAINTQCIVDTFDLPRNPVR